MHPELIKGELRMRGLTCASVADELKVTGSMVSRVINRVSSSARIEAHLANVIGQPVSELFPPLTTTTGLRRKRPTAPVNTTDASSAALYLRPSAAAEVAP